MSMRLDQLTVSGPRKQDAVVDFGGLSHLVFGPTDTGKSYIVECLRYCLGSGDRPRNVGWSEGYTTAALQISTSDGGRFTLFRDLVQGSEAVYKGAHTLPPVSPFDAEPLVDGIETLVVALSLGTGRKILTKSGTLGNFSAADLRYLSLFDEIETLDKVPLEGKDKLFKTRRRSAIALVLSGGDDSQAVLATTTNQRNVAKGHVEAIAEELQALTARLPERLTKGEVEAALSAATGEVEKIGTFLRSNVQELLTLKAQRAELERKSRTTEQRIASLVEANNRFNLLDLKYESDLQRLQALFSATAIAAAFETRPCPLCKTDLTHATSHAEDEQRHVALRAAARAESEKIVALRTGLAKALADVSEDIGEAKGSLRALRIEEQHNVEAQAALVQPAAPVIELGLADLTERWSRLTSATRDFERIELLNQRLAAMKTRAKRQTQAIDRDVSASAMRLSRTALNLLNQWGVPGVQSVFFDEGQGDIRINQRERISFGKGKRGIFLTAYVVSLMEHALERGHPHLGLVAIDSPVVTYKDPKHGSEDSEEALDVAVKDRFYAWLADRNEAGQVIVLENEEPDDGLKRRLHFTEFVGAGKAAGRRGFFPIERA